MSRQDLASSYLRLQQACALSNTADGISLVAIPLLAACITSSPAEIGLVAMARTLPWLVLSFPVGWLIDGIGPGRAVRLAGLGRAAVFIAVLALAIAPEASNVTALALLAFAVGALEVLFDNALQTLLPRVVPTGRLREANGRLSLIETVGNQLTGMPLGGALAALHPAAPFPVIACLYAVSLARAAGIRAGESPAVSGMGGGMMEGMRYVLQSPVLTALASITGLANIAVGGVAAIFVLYVTKHLGAPPWAYGVLFSAQAIGVAAAALLVPRFVKRSGEAVVLRLVVLALPIPLALLWATASFPVTFAAQALLGFLEGAWAVAAVAFRQEVVPAALLGRANAFYRLVASGTLPLGAWLAGIIAEDAGVPVTYGTLALGVSAVWILAPALCQARLDRERIRYHAA